MSATLIKKYGNRRLYDTGDSRYITLDELAAKVRGGADVRVVDARTGEDLTQATLTQVILESGNAARMLPVPLLAQLIRLGDDALGEFFSRYVTAALEMYLTAKRGVQSLPAIARMPLNATDALARMWMGFGAPAYAPPAYGYAAEPPPPAPPPPADREDDLAAMRRELDELKKAMREGPGRPGAKRKPRG